MRFFLTVFSLQPIHLISYEYIINSVFVVHGMHPTWLQSKALGDDFATAQY
jgi:hypothetical protein